jgi:hypothetical protein
MYAVQVYHEVDGWRFPQPWGKFEVYEKYEDARKAARFYAHARIVKLTIEIHDVPPKIKDEKTITAVEIQGYEGYWIELGQYEPATPDTIIFTETGRRFKPCP